MGLIAERGTDLPLRSHGWPPAGRSTRCGRLRGGTGEVASMTAQGATAPDRADHVSVLVSAAGSPQRKEV